MISFSKALGTDNLGEAEYLIWCYKGNLSPLACEQLRVKATAVDQLIMHEHDVLVHAGLVGSSARQPIKTMQIDNPLCRMDISVDLEPTEMELEPY